MIGLGMKKYLTFTISFAAIFIVGFLVGRSSALNDISKLFKAEKASLLPGEYISYVYISEKIRDGRYESAKCLADLRASSAFDQISECIKNDLCVEHLNESFLSRRSEFIENNNLPFVYYPESEGVRECED